MLDLVIVQYIIHSSQVYKKLVRDIAKKNNMTTVECDILLFLHKNPTFNTASQIATHRAIKKSNVSTALDKLIQKDFISVDSQGTKRTRCVYLELNKNAMPIVHELMDMQEFFSNIMYKGLSLEEKETLSKLLCKIDTNFQDYLI